MAGEIFNVRVRDEVKRIAHADSTFTFVRILQVFGIPLLLTLTGWTAWTFDAMRFENRELRYQMDTIKNVYDARLSAILENENSLRAEMNRMWPEILRNAGRLDKIEDKVK